MRMWKTLFAATAVAAVGALMPATSQAQDKTLTLCWAAWDPANALVSGENPFPEGYGQLPVSRIVHVHAKDCKVREHKPEFGPLGEMGIDWGGQVAALVKDGYAGWISLETHWPGPGGDKHQASVICGRKHKRGWRERRLTKA